MRAGSRLVEEALIREALAKTDGNVTRSARALGISRRSLQSKMKELGLRESVVDDPTKAPASDPNRGATVGRRAAPSPGRRGVRRGVNSPRAVARRPPVR